MFCQNVVSDYRTAAAEGELWDAILGIPRFRLMQFWGTYRGFAQEKPVSERVWRRFYYPDSNTYPSVGERDRQDSQEDDDTEIDYSSLLGDSRTE
jgi:hypothetical protein